MTTSNNNTTYTTHKITVKGNKYSITVVSGVHNYINVSKLTNNPFLTSGKDFKDFDTAVAHYKCADMKLELLKIELNLV